MIYGFENRSIALNQISDLCENGKYESYKIDKIFVTEIHSSKKRMLTYEPMYEYEDAKVRISKLLDRANDGDTVITSSLVNFSQSPLQVGKILKMFFEKGIRIIAILEDFDSSSYEATVLQEVCDIIIKYNKNSYHSKRKVYESKKTTKSIGRKPLLPSDFPDFENYYNKYMNREINKEQFAKMIDVSRPTLDKLIKSYSEQNEAYEKETD